MGERFQVYPFQRLKGASHSPGARRITRQWLRAPTAAIRRALAAVLPAVAEKARIGPLLAVDVNTWLKARTWVYLGMAFLLSRAVLLGELMPFGTAFLAAALAYYPFLSWGLMLAVLGGIWQQAPANVGGPLMAAAVLLTVLVTRARWNPRSWFLLLPFLVLTAHLTVQNIFLLYRGWNAYREIAVVFESIMAAALNFIFMSLFEGWEKARLENKRQGWGEAAGLAVLGAGLMMGVADVEIGGCSISAFAGGLLVLLVAFEGGGGAGAAAGALLGLLPSVTQLATARGVGIYAIAGLLGGLFRFWGKLGTALGYLTGYILLSFYMIEGAPGPDLLASAAASLVIFLLLPARLLAEFFSPAGWGEEDTKALGLKKDLTEGYPWWWQASRQRLYHLTAVMEELTCGGENGNIYSSARARTLLQVAEKILQELGKRVERDRETEQMVGRELAKLGVRGEKISVYTLPGGGQEIYFVRRGCSSYKDCFQRVARRLGSRLGKRMEARAETCSWPPPPFCEIILVEGEELRLRNGVAQAVENGADCSGDSVLAVSLSGGRQLLALSDGMGVGKRANSTSQRTLAWLERLLLAEVGIEEAVQMVNALLLLNSTEEEFATLDLAVADLRQGELCLVKMGSPASFLKRGDRVMVLKGENPPVGILEHLDLRVRKLKLLAGDVLVMVTDGVLDACFHAAEKEKWLAHILQTCPADGPQEMADYLISRAAACYRRHPDDMSVIVVFLEAAE